MAGVWTVKGLKKIKEAIANSQPISFTTAKLNISDAPVGSIELNAGLEELPNPYGALVPKLEYDEQSGILTAEIVVPPYFGIPQDKFVNGIGLYVEDVLAYVEQIIPRRIPNNSYARFKVKINIENYPGAFDIHLVSFSFNAGLSEKVLIQPGSTYSRSFASEVKEVKVYVKKENVYAENNGEVSVSLSEDLKTVNLTNTTDGNIEVAVFYLVGTNPIPEGITYDDVKKVASPIYVGSQPPAPSEGYLLFYYTEARDLYFANTDLNRWESITADIRAKVELFWDKVLRMHSLELAGRYGLYNYVINNCKDWEGWNRSLSSNVTLARNAIWFEAYKGDAVLISQRLKPKNADSYNEVDILFDVLGMRTNFIECYYDIGQGWNRVSPLTKLSFSDFSGIVLKFKVPSDAALRLSPSIFGLVIVSSRPLVVDFG
jgi:hypothetical protein